MIKIPNASPGVGCGVVDAYVPYISTQITRGVLILAKRFAISRLPFAFGANEISFSFFLAMASAS